MRILIADDDSLIRSALKIILSEKFEIAGEAGDGKEACELTNFLKPDLVLLDIRMPVMDGVQATKIIHEEHPEIKILILTTFSDFSYIKEAMKYGASGYLLKDSDKENLIEGIKSSFVGNIVMAPEAMEKFIAQNHDVGENIDEFQFTEKEIEILRFLSEGFSNKEIAEKLFLSEGTIKNNISVLLQKTGLRDSKQLISFAFKNGLVM